MQFFFKSLNCKPTRNSARFPSWAYDTHNAKKKKKISVKNKRAKKKILRAIAGKDFVEIDRIECDVITLPWEVQSRGLYSFICSGTENIGENE